MEAVVFSGFQASGKTSFYKERFFRSHVLISLDQLRIPHAAANTKESLVPILVT